MKPNSTGNKQKLYEVRCRHKMQLKLGEKDDGWNGKKMQRSLWRGTSSMLITNNSVIVLNKALW